jgi:hypothetical protein
MPPTPSHNCPPEPAETASTRLVIPQPAPSRGDHRTHHVHRRRWRRSPCLTHPATVWPRNADDPRDSTTPLAGWLPHAIATIVTSYTRPGDRVLLLAPPVITHHPPTGMASTTHRSPTDPLTGLHAAARTVSRLDRITHTRTANPPTKPGSGPGSTPGPDRFDVIITTVDPRTTDWISDTAWTDLLTPHGTLAIITHSDSSDGRLVDPLGRLVNTLRHHGLGWLDHVLLLETPLIAAADTATSAPPLPVRHRRVHSDLLLFHPQPSGTATGKRTSSNV